MKNYFFILLLMLSVQVASGQSSTNRQFYFFKVWNFVKYYHPALAGGAVNADTLFFKNLAAVDQLQSDKDFNVFIASFLKALPMTGTKEAPEVSGQLITKNLDQRWFKSGKLFDAANINRLNLIFKNRFTDSVHHYVPNVRFYAEIPNEPEYKYPDTVNIPYQLRLLSLAKLQGAVDYLFPHKYLMQGNFDEIVKHNLPLFAKCPSRTEYEKLLLNVVSAFDDTHSFSFIKQVKHKQEIFRNSFYPPFDYSVTDDAVIVTAIIVPEVCEQADIKKGDIIEQVNNVDVASVVNNLSKLMSVSNRPTLRYRLSDYLTNLLWATDKGNFVLTINRNGVKQVKNVEFIFNRETEKLKPVISYLNGRSPKVRTDKGLDIRQGNIAYININETGRWQEDVPDNALDKTMDSLLSVAAAQKGMIFDMRAYPDWGGFVYTYILKKFGNQPNRYGDYYEINKAAIGTFILNNEAGTYNNETIQTTNTGYKGKVVIIVDPATLSQSEWNTMNLQYVFPQSVTIGEQSAGADGDEKELNLPGGYKLNFTGNAIFYRDGTNAQRRGVKIDRKMPLTRAGILSPEDELLEEAYQIINGRQ